MKNVTLAMDEALLEKARGLAGRRKTTLNALIRSLLEHEVEQEDRIAWAREGIRRLMEESPLEFEPGTNFKELSRSRGDDQLSGHQHSDTRRRKKTG
ncbi:hypothetical protein [Mesorhizobium sp. WSM3224]|jgi:hypothetical protein|uniref:hypothetical protein n=1 Tax=Mesorhizobium sp. WSM3224 TaxID=1040986 RepID=UPI000401A2C4|nr:hypothetical protein [Mesorhizobium sp. WSM3224]